MQGTVCLSVLRGKRPREMQLRISVPLKTSHEWSTEGGIGVLKVLKFFSSVCVYVYVYTYKTIETYIYLEISNN